MSGWLEDGGRYVGYRAVPCVGGPYAGRAVVVLDSLLEVLIPHEGPDQQRYIRDRVPKPGRKTRFYWVPA